jgi:hypothetical protein
MTKDQCLDYVEKAIDEYRTNLENVIEDSIFSPDQWSEIKVLMNKLVHDIDSVMEVYNNENKEK